MKVIIQAFLLLSIALITTGCSSDYGTSNASVTDVQQMIDEQKTGFVVITNETDAPFLNEVQKALLEKKKRLCNSTYSVMMAKMKIQMD